MYNIAGLFTIAKFTLYFTENINKNISASLTI